MVLPSHGGGATDFISMCCARPCIDGVVNDRQRIIYARSYTAKAQQVSIGITVRNGKSMVLPSWDGFAIEVDILQLFLVTS